jgi:hypothetical protein
MSQLPADNDLSQGHWRKEALFSALPAAYPRLAAL